MSHFRLRPMITADLPQVIVLDELIFGEYGGNEEPATIRGRHQVFPAGCVVLESEEQEIAGYLTTEKWGELREPTLDENPYETHDPNGRVLNITTLAVAPSFQNHGLGKLILDKAIEIAQEQVCTQIVLETAHARLFYEKHGFDLIGERSQRDIPLYIMRLWLDRDGGEG